MAAENFEATQPTRAPESAPEPLFSRPEMQTAYEDSFSRDKQQTNTISDTKVDDPKKVQTLDFNTTDLYKQNSQFMQGDSGLQTTQQISDSSSASATSEQIDKGIETPELKARLSTGSTHVRKGEDFDAVAQRKLGENSSPEQREAFIKALKGVNGLDPNATLSRGQELKLPGVNDKGEFTHSNNGVERLWSPHDGRSETRTPDGITTSNYPDGSTEIDKPNGDRLTINGDTTTLFKKDGTSVVSKPSGETTYTNDGLKIERGPDGQLKRVDGPPLKGDYDKKDDGHGGTVERAAGGRPEENFTLVQGPNGRTEVFDKGPDGNERVSTFMKEPRVEAERKGTMERAEKLFTNPEDLARFKANMVRFEQRAADRGMAPEKVADTYKAISRMLDGGPNAKLPQGDRNVLAQQVMSHAANPTSLDQGWHNTCSVAALESNMYTKNPEKAAGLVADVALTGQFKGSDGRTLTVPEGSLKPDVEASTARPHDGKRDHASQLFQVTAVNLLYQDKYTLPWTYHQDNVGSNDYRADKGERDKLFGFDISGITRNKEFGGLNGMDVARINERITGQKDGDLFVPWSSNPEDMHNELARRQQEGKLPAMMWVHTKNPPFNDSGDGGGHFVNITGYDPATREVKMDNQWGSQRDHIKKGVPVEDMFLARRMPDDARKFRTENPQFFTRPR